MKLIRQGDILIKTKSDLKLPKGLKFKPVKILHKGNNHDHYFSSGEVMEATLKGVRYLKVKKTAMLSHGRGSSNEHKPLKIKAGIYWTEIQTEMDHLTGLKRQVID